MLKELELLWKKFEEGKDKEVTVAELKILHDVLKLNRNNLVYEAEKETLERLDRLGADNRNIISALIVVFNYI